MKREDIEKAAEQAYQDCAHGTEPGDLVKFAVQQINAVIEEMEVALDDQVTWSDYDPSETAVEVIRRFKMEAK